MRPIRVIRPTEEMVLRWHLHARSTEYALHLRYAMAAIARVEASAGRMVLSWSGGKDSTAMVHLVRTLYPDTPIVVQFDDCDWPEKRPYVKRVASAHGWEFYAVKPDMSVWERMANGAIGEEEFCAQSHALTRDAFLAPLAEAQHELGCDGVYMGLRAEESKARRAHLSVRHEVYQLKSGEWRCCPLARWTATDVFAYLTEHGVEINPCYFNNRFMPPEEIRLSWAVPTPASLRHGDVEHMRLYYPEQFRRLRDLGVC